MIYLLVGITLLWIFKIRWDVRSESIDPTLGFLSCFEDITVTERPKLFWSLIGLEIFVGLLLIVSTTVSLWLQHFQR